MIGLRNGNQTYIFFLSILIISVIIAIYYTPNKAILLIKENTPEAEARFANFYEYNRYGLQKQVNSDSIIFFNKDVQGGYNVVYHKFNYIDGITKIDSIISSFIKRDKNLLNFPNSVIYTQNDLFAWSEKAVYNIDNLNINGNGKFVILNTEGNISGYNLIYDGKKQSVFGQNIISFYRRDN